MKTNYSNACTEVLTLFDFFLDKDDYDKIPLKQIEYMKKVANTNYTYIVDENKELEEQAISIEARAIIISLYKKYFANPSERNRIDCYVRNKKKQKIVHTQTLTNNNFSIFTGTKDIPASVTISETKSMIKRETLWSKIWNKIHSIFKK